MIKEHKVTNEDIVKNNVKSTQGRRLTGDVQSNKGVFDKLPEKIAERHNGLINELSEIGIDDINTKLDTKADEKSVVLRLADKINRDELSDIQLQVERMDSRITELDNLPTSFDISNKASIDYVDARLETKADKIKTQNALNSKADNDRVSRELSQKMDTTTAQNLLDRKADLLVVESRLNNKASQIELNALKESMVSKDTLSSELSGKVDVSNFNERLSNLVSNNELTNYIKKNEKVNLFEAGTIKIFDALPTVVDGLLDKVGVDNSLLPKKAIKALLETRLSQFKEELKELGIGSPSGEVSGVSSDYVNGKISELREELKALIPTDLTGEITKILNPIQESLEYSIGLKVDRTTFNEYKASADSLFAKNDRLYGDDGDIKRINIDITKLKTADSELKNTLNSKLESKDLIQYATHEDVQDAIKLKADKSALDEKANRTELNQKVDKVSLTSEISTLKKDLTSEIDNRTSGISESITTDVLGKVQTKIAERALKTYVDDKLSLIDNKFTSVNSKIDDNNSTHTSKERALTNSINEVTSSVDTIKENLKGLISEETLKAFESLGWKRPEGGVLASLIGFIAHPIGSYYWSEKPADPAKIFGGRWERVEDKFVYAAGSKSVGVTGGEERHTLTVDEMPQHNGHVKPYGGVAAYLNAQLTNYGDSGRGWIRINGNEPFPYSENTGGSKSHNNMPPYVTAYCWKRIG